MLKLSKKISHNDEKESTIVQEKEQLEWQEIKTPSTVVGRRSCHSSCMYQDK
jgi:hypothetical protein